MAPNDKSAVYSANAAPELQHSSNPERRFRIHIRQRAPTRATLVPPHPKSPTSTSAAPLSYPTTPPTATFNAQNTRQVQLSNQHAVYAAEEDTSCCTCTRTTRRIQLKHQHTLHAGEEDARRSPRKRKRPTPPESDPDELVENDNSLTSVSRPSTARRSVSRRRTVGPTGEGADELEGDSPAHQISSATSRRVGPAPDVTRSSAVPTTEIKTEDRGEKGTSFGGEGTLQVLATPSGQIPPSFEGTQRDPVERDLVEDPAHGPDRSSSGVQAVRNARSHAPGPLQEASSSAPRRSTRTANRTIPELFQQQENQDSTPTDKSVGKRRRPLVQSTSAANAKRSRNDARSTKTSHPRTPGQGPAGADDEDELSPNHVTTSLGAGSKEPSSLFVPQDQSTRQDVYQPTSEDELSPETRQNSRPAPVQDTGRDELEPIAEGSEDELSFANTQSARQSQPRGTDRAQASDDELTPQRPARAPIKKRPRIARPKPSTHKRRSTAANKIPITIYRPVRPSDLDADPLGADPTPGLNPVDVLAQVTGELTADVLQRLEGRRRASSGAQRSVVKRQRKAVRVFDSVLQDTLFELSLRANTGVVLGARVRKARRLERELRAELLTLRAERGEIELEAKGIAEAVRVGREQRVLRERLEEGVGALERLVARAADEP
ncbi:hypothetical protein EJ06DRAFT_572875 [Trichodelitschia bisporula]|uniref:Inner kinetochore subunit AME1 domain-containing protein n=1 Tax=Trichodelitschia bisporula TaxID=703511 RepID=A0A6G1I3W3_9PEZI|nr:hypothetical protein EJ06DRAFT_572875 [Trichodelitschia bisporula]